MKELKQIDRVKRTSIYQSLANKIKHIKNFNSVSVENNIKLRTKTVSSATLEKKKSNNNVLFLQLVNVPHNTPRGLHVNSLTTNLFK
jgi:hypothetical protein